MVTHHRYRETDKQRARHNLQMTVGAMDSRRKRETDEQRNRQNLIMMVGAMAPRGCALSSKGPPYQWRYKASQARESVSNWQV